MKRSTKMYLTLFVALLISNIVTKALSNGLTHCIDLVKAEERSGE